MPSLAGVVVILSLASCLGGVLTADPGENGSCVNLALPDIAGLGECLGDALQTCGTSQTPVEALGPILQCTVQVLTQSGSLSKALKSLGNIIYLLLKVVNENLAKVFQAAVKLIPGSVTLTGCEGTISVGVPNTLVGQCTTDLGNLCSTSVGNLVPGLVKALECLLNEVLNTDPQTTAKTLLCDIFNVGDVGVGVPGSPLDGIVDGIKDYLQC